MCHLLSGVLVNCARCGRQNGREENDRLRPQKQQHLDSLVTLIFFDFQAPTLSVRQAEEPCQAGHVLSVCLRGREIEIPLGNLKMFMFFECVTKLQ